MTRSDDNRSPGEAPLPRRADGSLDVEAMSPAQIDAFLRRRPLPAGVRPILLAGLCSVLWFVVLSPLVTAPLGPNLSPQVIDKGQAQVSACSRSWSSLWVMYSCRAEVQWQNHGRSSARVLSNRALPTGPVAVVARDRLGAGRSSNVTTLTRRTVVVPAGFPANSGLSVVQLTLLNVAVMVVVWGLAIWRITT